ncbi:MAG: hypothetical protein NZO41_00655 [Candidatus Bipolaricaulota bacterium]|nr:hypothetical protein [Candidatus Bipolaricaulota bacterium]MDW8141060.1 hypothetical protein [Candidatus Bipolaricaulota bacterium]
MSPKQKEFYADKAVDLAHIIGGALVIGQFVAERFEAIVFALGVIAFVSLYVASYFLTREA